MKVIVPLFLALKDVKLTLPFESVVPVAVLLTRPLHRPVTVALATGSPSASIIETSACATAFKFGGRVLISDYKGPI